jgi:hypothetical protein
MVFKKRMKEIQKERKEKKRKEKKRKEKKRKRSCGCLLRGVVFAEVGASVSMLRLWMYSDVVSGCMVLCWVLCDTVAWLCFACSCVAWRCGCEVTVTFQIVVQQQTQERWVRWRSSRRNLLLLRHGRRRNWCN